MIICIIDTTRTRCHRFILAILGAHTVQFSIVAIGTIYFEPIQAIDVAAALVDGETTRVAIGTGGIGENVKVAVIWTVVTGCC
jgi:hypothetical protein